VHDNVGYASFEQNEAGDRKMRISPPCARRSKPRSGRCSLMLMLLEWHCTTGRRDVFAVKSSIFEIIDLGRTNKSSVRTAM
jgi:hypothetical protein